jgi:hypothetical protein
MRDYPSKFSAGLVKRKNTPLFEEGGEVETGEPEELEQNPSGRRSIYGDMDVSSMARRAVDADNKAYEAADTTGRAKMDTARRRTPGYKRGGAVKK